MTQLNNWFRTSLKR